MVLGNQVLDDLGQVSILGNLEAVAHVVDDNLGAVLGAHQVVVRVLADLVLGEEGRIFGLADVVVECSGTHELHVGSDLERCLAGQVGHL